MELTKKLLPKLSIKNPLDIYRMGWLALAGTSVVYMAVILIKAGLGINTAAPSQVRYTQAAPHKQMAMTNYSHNSRAAHTNSNHKRANVSARSSAQEKIRNVRTLTNTKRYQRMNENSNGHNTHKQVHTARTRDRRTAVNQQARKQNMVPNNTDLALDNMNQANYMQKFTYDLNSNEGHTKPVIKVVKARKVNTDIFGVRLAKGKSVSAIRREWKKLKAKYKRPLRNLEPLIIKENNGDGYPIHLIVGPFSDSPSAVRFCSSIYRRFNCSLKRYNGSPL